MNSRNNQRGFGVVEIIIIIVVLAVLGFGGWYVWQAQNRSTEPQNTTNGAGGSTTLPKNTATFSDSRLPYTFEYPKDWTVKIDERLKSGQPIPDQYWVELQAPGTVLTEEPIGGVTVAKGARVRVLDTKATIANIQDKFSGFYAQTAKDRVNVSVDGAAAVEYSFAYESDPGIFTDLIKGGRDYSLGFYAEGDERASTYITDYKSLVSSFKVK